MVITLDGQYHVYVHCGRVSGATKLEAISGARDLIVRTAQSCMGVNKRIPRPEYIKGKNYEIRLSPTCGLKMMLWNLMCDKNLTLDQLHTLTKLPLNTCLGMLDLYSDKAMFDSIYEAFVAIGNTPDLFIACDSPRD